MIILIDDIKLNNEEEFFVYINNLIKDCEIDSLDTLRDYLLSADEDIELIISDIDEVENQRFADDLRMIFEGVTSANSKIKFTLM